MSKIEINQVAEILKRNKAEPALLRAVVQEMNMVTMREEDEKTPPVKKQYVILVSDPEGRFPKHDFAGWVLQIPDEDSPATTQDRINRAIYDFNATKKGRMLPVKSVGAALEQVPSKHFKEYGAWVKTKEPVLVFTTNNEIPFDSAQ